MVFEWLVGPWWQSDQWFELRLWVKEELESEGETLRGDLLQQLVALDEWAKSAIVTEAMGLSDVAGEVTAGTAAETAAGTAEVDPIESCHADSGECKEEL
eukprot:SAG31_NODE_3732_length_3940_cov_35.007550_3_plen_100_part_00